MGRRSRADPLVVAMLVLAGCTADADPTPTRTPIPTSGATAGTSASPPPPTPASGGAYLAAGDSITFGIGVADPRTNGFVGRVSRRLKSAKPPITETRVFAVPGETAGGFLDRRLDDVQAAIADLGPRVELVTIGLGANELLRARREPACQAEPAGGACRSIVDAAVAEAAESLDAIVAAVKAALEAARSDARVLLLAYYNPDPDPIAAATLVGADGSVACDAAEPGPGLNDRIACVAARHGAEVVDLYAAFLGREDELTRFGTGDVHPNADGYAVIAEAILTGFDE